MGCLAAPCNDFIRKYEKQIKKLDVITCCGSTDAKKDDTFGYGKVFTRLEERLGDKCGIHEAFPIELVLSDAQKSDDQAMMNTRLNDDNFAGEIGTRLKRFSEKVSSLLC